MKLWILIVFLVQVFIQGMLKHGYLDYGTSNPVHEDLVTTLLFCTAMIVLTMYDIKEK